MPAALLNRFRVLAAGTRSTQQESYWHLGKRDSGWGEASENEADHEVETKQTRSRRPSPSKPRPATTWTPWTPIDSMLACPDSGVVRRNMSAYLSILIAICVLAFSWLSIGILRKPIRLRRLTRLRDHHSCHSLGLASSFVRFSKHSLLAKLGICPPPPSSPPDPVHFIIDQQDAP